MKKISVFAVAALAAGLAACNDRQAAENQPINPAPAAAPENAQQPTGAQQTGPVTVAAITGDPMQYQGKQVTVEGEMEKMFGPQAFKLDHKELADRDLMVVAAKDKNVNVAKDWVGKRVRVTGTVRPITITEVEQEIGWDLDRQVEVEIEGVKAVLVADSVEQITS